jgi:hypothetical protein
MENNKYRGVPIEIDGQPLFLRFDFNSLVALEEALGTFDPKFEALGFKGQRALIWAGLQHDKNAPTLVEVGDMLGPYLKDPKRYSEILEAAAKAHSLAFPDALKAAAPAGVSAVSSVGAVDVDAGEAVGT